MFRADDIRASLGLFELLEAFYYEKMWKLNKARRLFNDFIMFVAYASHLFGFC